MRANGTSQTGVTLKIHVLEVKHQTMESDEILCRHTRWRYERDFLSQVERVVSELPKGAGSCPACRSMDVRRSQEVRWGELRSTDEEMSVHVNVLFESYLRG